MKVYFRAYKKREKSIGTCSDLDGGLELIRAYWETERDKPIYYIKYHENENGVHIDVGSHVEFFRIK